MESLLPIATFFVAFLSSILSGLAGGGGSFIMAPYWLISGMTPAQGATTGAFMALGMGSSSLVAYKGSGHMPKNKRLIALLLAITLGASAIGPFFLQHIRTDTFKPILATLTILSLPFLFINRKDIALSVRQKQLGVLIMALLLLASSFITSSAFSILMTVVLIRSFELTTLQSTAIRRLIGIVQSAVIFVILFTLGNFIPAHAVAALIGGSLGSYIGTKISLKKGEKFAKYALAIGALTSALLLVI